MPATPTPDGVPAGHVVVGRVGKPFGVRGEVYVFADPDLDDPFDPGTAYAAAGRGTLVGGTLVVDRSRDHSGRLVVAFEGVEDREGAEALRGTVLTRDRGAVALDEGAVWVADLIGRTVVDTDGRVVGVVEAVADGHAHDYLRLARPDGGEAVIPLVADLVDTDADPIVLAPVPGLLDPDEAL
ncbi:ribosome maturation factor RimM [Euzebya sp.]|uniref:ribosome maturation factor RimM n=1 Tax=Euzebya sp. TaxID=1971409 RepID=UPI0035158553